MPPQPLLVLHADRALLDILPQAAPTGLELVDAGGWEELRAGMLANAPGALALVDPHWGGTGFEPAPELARLLRGVRSVPVITAWRGRSPRSDVVLKLGAWGVAEVVTGRTIAPRRLRQALTAARARYVARLLDEIAPHDASHVARLLLAEALDVAAARESAEAWAATFGISSRTLLRNCQAAGLPTPRRMLAWMRVLLATELLESPDHTAATAALACGYASDVPFRRATQQLTGFSPSDLQSAGGMRTAAALFHAELLHRLGGRPHEEVDP